MDTSRVSFQTDVWARLLETKPLGETLWGRLAADGTSDRLIAAVGANGQRHLLVRLLDGDDDLTDLRSRGISVKTVEFVVPAIGPGRFIDLECDDILGFPILDLVGEDLARGLSASNASAPRTVSLVLSKWRRFWGNLPRTSLAHSQQVGLFGELWFLAYWLLPHCGIPNAVERWKGPFGSRHDFETTGLSVEAKTTSLVGSRTHRVHGLDQLVAPEHGELFLYSLRVREDGGATNTLPSLVRRCRQLFESDSEASSRFDVAIVRSGYLDAHAPDYESVRYRIVDEDLYEVRDDFPRLTPAELKADVPTGVSNVSYEIDLAGSDRFRIASSPQGAWSRLL